jgi:polyisoprenoid-binding protein YceI
MRPKNVFACLALLSITILTRTATAAIDVPSGQYVLENTHAYITFSYSHLGFSTPQISFTEFDVDLQLDTADPTNSTLNVIVDANSVESQVDEFNEHLVGERFFDTANHPNISFKSTSIERGAADSATISGDLTIKGITHPVVLSANLNKAGNHPRLKKPMAGFNAQTKVLRSAWDLGYGVPMVGDEVTISISVELQQAE